MTIELATGLPLATDLPLVVDALSRLFQPDTLARILVEGLGKAAVYFVLAVGLTLVFGLMGVLNFSHGAMAMLGAYVGGLLMVLAVSDGTGTVARIAFFFVAVVAVFAVLTAFGSTIEYSLIRPIYDRTPMYQILLTFGIALILEEVTRIVVLARGIQPDPPWSAAMATAPALFTDRYDVLGAPIRGLYAFEIVLGVLAVAGVWLFLNRTLYGLYIRAGSEDPEMVEALGIDVRRAFTIVFGLGTGLAGIGGVFLMWDPLWGPSALLAIDVLLYAFVVVIIGGLGSFEGTVAASLLVGITDSFTTWLFSTGIVTFTGLPALTIFGLLVLMLILRPQGLYGVEEVGGH
ncbi:branched-chain amino acid ABC transporter permease [Halosolutus amylolyticus]|uniref:Branched-chain amino acid ABC transporter permease n=1 Tax=Halosolutus amylolyticus TaxID=2932267 RepID=A0ABD5PP61_9EURY|nr:branched-chain amino acid ABC transporter permease [Halosolutus amylolyticus]